MSKKETEKVPTWVYPKDKGEPEIMQLPAGCKPPEGFAFSPVKRASNKAKK